MVYANIGGILMVNVTIYSIHGSYGFVRLLFYAKKGDRSISCSTFFRDDIDGSQNPESESVESVKTTKNVICLSHFFIIPPKMFRFS